MTGSRPAGLLLPASVFAIAVPPSSPEYQDFEDGVGMLLFPFCGERAAVHEHDDERLACLSDRPNERFFRIWNFRGWCGPRLRSRAR